MGTNFTLPVERRHELCSALGHPGATYHPQLDRTWCTCGERTYPGSAVDWAHTKHHGVLATARIVRDGCMATVVPLLTELPWTEGE